MSRPSLRLLPLAGLAATAFTVAACAGSSGPTWAFSAVAPVTPPMVAGPVGSPSATSGARHQPVSLSRTVAYAARTARLDLTIVTGDMIGKTEFPAYVPSDFTLPADSVVTVTITNFDDATPLPASSRSYSKSAGLVGGTFATTPIDPRDPNGAAGRTTVAAALDPDLVSHTFTIPGLGVNVPIAAHARVTFTFRTGAPGRYAWRCFDPCGAGPNGWGTAMASQRGYMEGTLTVAG